MARTSHFLDYIFIIYWIVFISDFFPHSTLSKGFPTAIIPAFTLAVAGVLFVRVHKGTKLIPMDPDGLSDPYVMVFANQELVSEPCVHFPTCTFVLCKFSTL